MTKQRMIIMDVIRSVPRHMTAEEIYQRASELFPSMAMATVYNNLNALVRDGKVRRIPVPGQPDHYDRNMVYHEHLVCEQCGELVDAELGNLKEEMEKRLGKEILGYSLVLYYLCEACTKHQNGEEKQA